MTTSITKKLTTEQISSLFDDLTGMKQVLNSIDYKLDIVESQRRHQEIPDNQKGFSRTQSVSYGDSTGSRLM